MDTLALAFYTVLSSRCSRAFTEGKTRRESDPLARKIPDCCFIWRLRFELISKLLGIHTHVNSYQLSSADTEMSCIVFVHISDSQIRFGSLAGFSESGTDMRQPQGQSLLLP